MKENWRDVVGYEGLYEVSNLGRVRNAKKLNILKEEKSRFGYIRVTLCRNGTQKHLTVHQILYLAFVGPIPYGMQIDHIDGDKANNTLSNLRAVTPKENSNNPVTRERFIKGTNDVMPNRINTTRASLGKPVLQLDPVSEVPIRVWQCVRDAERELGIKHCNISFCCHGKQKTAGGYRWKFA